jgi:hypothetical protein
MLEQAERADGQHPNQQVRAIGTADLFPDPGGLWTGRITEKYVRGASAKAMRASRAADDRVAIRLRPDRLVAVASES